jgi:O-antigen/teichoic acid export membrane protein
LFVQAGTLLIVARLLGPTNFGAFAAIAALAVLMGTLATFGTHLALLRDVSQASAKGKQMLPLALGTTSLCGAVLLALYLVLSFWWLDLDTVDPAVFICIGISELVLQPFLLIVAMERHANGKVAGAQVILALPQALRFCVGVMMWWASPPSPLLIYAMGYLAAIVIALVASIRSLPIPLPSPKTWRTPTKAEWGNNAGFALLGLTGTGPGELDKTLAARLLSPHLAGIYAAASRVVGALVVPVVAVVLSSLPRLFRESNDRSTALKGWLFAACFLYGTLAGVAVWCSAPLVAWLFGPGYDRTEQAVKWLAFALPGMSLRLAAMNVLTTLALPWIRVFIELFGLLLLGILSWWLSRSLLITGLICGVVASEWAIATMGWTTVLLHHHALSRNAPQQNH